MTNQLQWYGGRNLYFLFTPEQLQAELNAPRTATFVVDRASFDSRVRYRIPYTVVADSGTLICFRIGAKQLP